MVRMGKTDVRMIRTTLLAIAATACFAASPVSAQGISNTVYVGGSIPLQVPVTATIGGRCQFGGTGPDGVYDAGRIDEAAWSNDFDFAIECNIASRVAVESANGGLATAQSVTDPGYLTLAPYTVGLNLQGTADTAAASCDVESLAANAAAPCSFRGPASTLDGLRLPGAASNETGTYLRVSAPPYAGPGTLVAGNYTDTLTVTISAEP